VKLKVLNVDKSTMDDGRVVWRVKYEVSDRNGGEQPLFYHHFLDDQISYYMAAYGIDDVGEILDMILDDPFHDDDPGLALLRAANTGEARKDHRKRCVKTRARTSLDSQGIENPLEMIRSSHTPTPVSLAHGEDAVRNARKEFRRMNRG